MRIIDRYLSREVIVTTSIILTLVLLIFISNNFVRYLTEAASGKYAAAFISKLLLLEMPQLIALLLPLALFLALLLTYSRYYNNQELVVLNACGYGRDDLMSITFKVAGACALIATVVIFWLNPSVLKIRNHVLSQAKQTSFLQLVHPGRFLASKDGQKVYFVGYKKEDGSKAQNIFIAERAKKSPTGDWDITVAKSAVQRHNNGQTYLVLEKGGRYIGHPGQSDYRIIHFGEYLMKLTAQPSKRVREESLTLAQLWKNRHDSRDKAELQWRVSLPITILLLSLLAMPLSRIRPRQGKFARILPAILIYSVYSNFLLISREWLEDDKIPALVGLWWPHLLMLITIALFWKRYD